MFLTWLRSVEPEPSVYIMFLTWLRSVEPEPSVYIMFTSLQLSTVYFWNYLWDYYLPDWSRQVTRLWSPSFPRWFHVRADVFLLMRIQVGPCSSFSGHTGLSRPPNSWWRCVRMRQQAWPIWRIEDVFTGTSSIFSKRNELVHRTTR